MSSLSHRFSEFINSSRCSDRRAIVFIDPRVARYDDLIQQVAPEVRVILLGLLNDGVAAITEILRVSRCQEVHLICSGVPGCLYLGRSELSKNTLIQHEAKLQHWFSHLNLNYAPRLYLNGSNVGMGDGGAEFIEKLAFITGAKISTSSKIGNSKVFS